MQFFPDRTAFLTIGVLSIKWYAIFIVTGALVAFYFTRKETRKMGYKDDVVENYFYGVLILGIIGARLWYCLFYAPAYFFSNPIEILKIYTGGLAIQGGLMAGLIFTYFYTKHYFIGFIRFADVVMPNVLIAQSFGRWGNFINSEAHGSIVNESFFNYYPKFIKEGMFINGDYYMPTFLFESIGTLAGWIIISFIMRFNKNTKRGQLFFAYFIWYGIVRFFVEGLRTDSLMFGPIRVAQLLAIFGFVVGMIGYLGGFNKLIFNKKPIIIFDLDGTLLDTRNAIIKTYQQLFEKYLGSNSFTEEIKLEVLGPSLKEIFIKYFPNQNTDQLVSEYIQINRDLHKEYVKPIPNALETLDYLKNQGYTMAIVSTKKQESIRYGLSMFDMEKYFDVIMGEDDYSKSKPAKDGIVDCLAKIPASIDNVIYVGDTKTDVLAGKNAGVFTVGYIYDLDRKEDLINSEPNAIISDLKELKKLLEVKNQVFTYNKR